MSMGNTLSSTAISATDFWTTIPAVTSCYPVAVPNAAVDVVQEYARQVAPEMAMALLKAGTALAAVLVAGPTCLGHMLAGLLAVTIPVKAVFPASRIERIFTVSFRTIATGYTGLAQTVLPGVVGLDVLVVYTVGASATARAAFALLMLLVLADCYVALAVIRDRSIWPSLAGTPWSTMPALKLGVYRYWPLSALLLLVSLLPAVSWKFYPHVGWAWCLPAGLLVVLALLVQAGAVADLAGPFKDAVRAARPGPGWLDLILGVVRCTAWVGVMMVVLFRAKA